ncbi:Long-chain-fatty-acid--CoA ligase [Mycolicibacterium rhodesiae JS60]|nr:Long-chain-fatty-acid--CoA ligase [Mycolicibacterium rhodesiae JS60]
MTTVSTSPNSVSELLSVRSGLTPDDVVVRCAGEAVTARELDDRVTRVARGLLAQGLQPGDRVGVLLPTSMPFVELIFACSRAGLVQVPLNAFLKGDFLRHQLVDSGAAALVTDEDGLRTAVPLLDDTQIEHTITVESDYEQLRNHSGEEPLPSCEPSELAVLMYTSGTTGLPKACMLSHAYQINVARAYHEAGWVATNERVYTALPLYHAAGQLTALMTALYAAGDIVFPDRFRATQFMLDAAENEATLVLGVMAMATAILASSPDNDPPFGVVPKAIWVPLDAANQKAFADRFGCRVTSEGYGQSEATAICLNPFDSGIRRPGTMGRPTSFVEVAVVDDNDAEVPIGEVGELVVRPRVPGAIFSGYWNRPDATVAAFRNLWYHTGDYGRRHDDGFFSFVDRKKDAMRRRGENVSSVELERAIMAHASIREAAVHAVPSQLGEDDIKVCLVLADDPIDLPELFEFFKEKLPYFAVPRYVEFLAELPKNGVGRVLKHKLREEGVNSSTVDLESLGLAVAKADRRGRDSRGK